MKKEREIICIANDEPITYEQFINACREVGLREGDTIFIHSDLLELGELVIKDSRITLALMVSAFQQVVGANGTIMMPTFTYSFLSEDWSGPREVFDVDRSPSKTGALTEYFRKQPNVIRTDHPTHSVAIWGRRKEFYSDIGESTYGKDSIFGKLHVENVKIMGLGYRSLPGTFLHFIEKQFGVPYRYTRTLVGSVIRNGEVYQKKITFYQKREDYSPRFERFVNHLRSSNKVKRSPIGGGEIWAIEARIAFEEGMRVLQSDPYYFEKKKTSVDKPVSWLKAATKRLFGK